MQVNCRSFIYFIFLVVMAMGLIACDASNEKNYGKNVKGTITLTSIPKKSGGHLIGYLEATAQIEFYGDVAKRTINIDMQFDIVANESTFHLCE